MKCLGIVALIFILLVGSGCLSMKRDEHGRYLPRIPQWSLKKSAGDPEHLLKYDVVYVCVADDSRASRYMVIRFWPSGHVMEKGCDDYEDIEYIDSFRGAVGYYRVGGNGELVIETYGPVNFGQYQYTHYKIDEAGDILSISWGPHMRWWQNQYPVPLRFSPRYIGELNLQPDW